MPEEKKQINMGIENGEDFFAHEMSVNFSPTQFIFDFRCVTPRIDPRTREAPFISLKHNVVLVDPFHAKRILEVLTKTIGDYEKQFGKIEMPKALEKHEKTVKKAQKEDSKETMPSYFG
jgi:hypothetical protein